MGRGLGKLQREILTSLEESRDSDFVFSYYGGANPNPPYWTAPIAVQHGTRFALAEGVYDLRAVKTALGKHDSTRRSYDTFTPTFSATFSRACHRLVEQGYLERGGPRFYDDQGPWQPRELRFVTITESAKDICVALMEQDQAQRGARKAAARANHVRLVNAFVAMDARRHGEADAHH